MIVVLLSIVLCFVPFVVTKKLWVSLYVLFYDSPKTTSFGYVVKGADFLSAIQEGDIIVSAKVTEGAKNLVLPKAPAPAA